MASKPKIAIYTGCLNKKWPTRVFRYFHIGCSAVTSDIHIAQFSFLYIEMFWSFITHACNLPGVVKIFLAQSSTDSCG